MQESLLDIYSDRLSCQYINWLKQNKYLSQQVFIIFSIVDMGCSQSPSQKQRNKPDFQLLLIQQFNIIADLSEGFAKGNELLINNSIKSIYNFFKKINNQQLGLKSLKKKTTTIEDNVKQIRQVYMNFTVDIANKLFNYYQSFTRIFKLVDGKTIMSSQELFSLLHQQLQKQQLLSIQDLKQHQDIQSQLQMIQQSSKQTKKMQLQSFITVFWIGKSVLGMIALKLRNKSRHSKLNQEKYFYLEDKEWIDPKIYLIISHYFEWMRMIPSFKKLLDCFQNKLAPKAMQLSQQDDSLNNDKLIDYSATNFIKRFNKIIQRQLKICKLWNQIHQKFLKNRSVKIGLKEDEFYRLVNQLHNYLGNSVQQKNDISKRINQQDIQTGRTTQMKRQENQNIIINQEDKETIIQLTAKLQEKQTEIRRLNQQLRKRSYNYSNANQNHSNLIEQQKRRIQELEKNQRSQNHKIQQLQKNVKSDKEKIQQLEDKLDVQQQLNQSLKEKIKNIETSVWQQCTQINQQVDALNTIEVVKSQYGQNEKKNQSSQKVDSLIDNINKYLTRTKIKIKNQITDYNKANQKYQQNTSKLIEQKKILQQKVKQIEKQINSYVQTKKIDSDTINKLEHITQDLNSRIKSKSQTIENIEKQLKQSNGTVSDLTGKIQSINSKLSQSELKIAQITQLKEKQFVDSADKVTNLSQQLKTKTKELQQTKNKYSEIELQFKQKCKQLQAIRNIQPPRSFTQYFNGNILNIDTPKDTEWFVNSLQGHLGKKIKTTRLLYKMDLQNKVSFHHYIDNKPNIVLLAKMTNGQVIGGYSEPPFKPQTNVDYKPGMMFGFNNHKVFTIKRKPSSKQNKTHPKPITYDEYYIIWGNSDIRIKSGCKELFSNYSTSNCSYEESSNKNPSISDFFMQTERDAILVEYELHQIMFENEESYRQT